MHSRTFMLRYIFVCVFILFSFAVEAQSVNSPYEVRKDTLPSRQELIKRARKDYGPWMISLGAGYARWLVIFPEGTNQIAKDYYNQLLWGFVPSVSATYFLKFGLGFGLEYNGYFSDAKLNEEATVSLNNGMQITGTLAEKVSMQLFGAGMQYRLIKKNGSGYFNFGVGLGYFHFKDALNVSSYSKGVTTITSVGKSVGMKFHASYNYRIDRHVSIGLGIGLTNGLLLNTHVEDGYSSYTDTSFAGSLIHVDLKAKLTIIL